MNRKLMMNPPAPMIYLAGAIFGKSDAECSDWREQAAKSIQAGSRNRLPGTALSPMVRDARGQEYDPLVRKAVVEADKVDIMQSNGVLLMLREISAGTMMELIFAWEQGKPVVVINSTGKDQLSMWIHYHSVGIIHTHTCTTEGSAINQGLDLLAIAMRERLPQNDFT